MIKNKLEDYHQKGDRLHGFFVGVVENNNDPEKLGRVKIRIYGLHTKVKIKTKTEGIPTEELPWAMPVCGLYGGISGYGNWEIPLQGTHVLLFFFEGHPLKPYYVGAVPGIPIEQPNPLVGYFDPAAQYPEIDKLGEPDSHRLFRGEKTKTCIEDRENDLDTGITKALEQGEWDEPSPAFAAQYPHNKVFSTHGKIVVEMDSTPGEERVHIYHPSKSFIEIDKDGNVVIKNAKDKYEIVMKKKHLHVKGESHETIDEDRTKYVKKKEWLQVDDDQKEEIKGKREILSKEETIEESEVKYTIKAPEIILEGNVLVKGNLHVEENISTDGSNPDHHSH